MVFISVGTQKHDFKRLFNVIEKSEILKNETIVIQYGYSNIENMFINNKKVKKVQFVSNEEFLEFIKKAELIIVHGGVGSIFSALEQEKKVMAVPRLKKYNEHINDHQLEICEELEKEDYIVIYHDGEDFDLKIKQLKDKVTKKYTTTNDYLNILRNEI